MSDSDEHVQAGLGYPVGQMARAFVTASSHEDATTRQRAEGRLRRWLQVISGMAGGVLSVGSRAPVAGLPEWATPEVVRGGFATGTASAAGPLLPYEIEAARRAGVPAERRALFMYYLTEAGLAELGAMLDTGRYEIAVPEEAALLVVAWLLRAGDRLSALDLLGTIGPFAGQLRFAPRPCTSPAADPQLVCRQTIGQVREALERRRPDPAVEAMREAVLVWNPFGDDLLILWLETAESGRIASRMPADWLTRGSALLARYQELAARHPYCSKHRRPKENIAILRGALDEVTAGRTLSQRQHGLLQHAVDSMVARRGRPGSGSHTALRERQHANAARPTHHALTQVLISRLTTFPQHTGIPNTGPLTQPVTASEAADTQVPPGTGFPPSLHHITGRALSARVGTLIERGLVPSTEVLAEVLPQMTASAAAASYADDALRSLMAAHYRAFRNRRSLLLLNLDHQTGVGDLPWIKAVAAHRAAGASTQHAAYDVLRQLSELAVQNFPATILPNTLIRELDTLAKAAGLDVPLVEELAADIFMGTFSAKFLRAAKLAAGLLAGTLYERYYGIDYAAVLTISDVTGRPGLLAPTSDAFARLCHSRSGVPDGGGSVAANGMGIEQSQILTTHNLAALVDRIGIDPASGWAGLARLSFETCCRLVAHMQNNPRPLRTIKDAAYAWRQALFFLSLTTQNEQNQFIAWAGQELTRQPGHVAQRLTPVLTGLRHTAAGGSLDEGAIPDGARRFLGWSLGGHWMQVHTTRVT